MTGRELHGAKGQAYPVRRGEVWECYGHLVACGDLEAGAGEQLLAFGRARQQAPALFYVDPPWSSALLTRFRNAAGADIHSAYTVESAVRRIARLARGVPLLLEMGTSYDRDEVESWLDDHESASRVLVPIKHGGGKPAWLYARNVPVHAFAGRGPGGLQTLAGLDDNLIPGRVIPWLTEPGDVVVDLCLGLGCTLRAAERTGRVCWGLELVPERCSSALASLTKIRPIEPVPIGELK